jgi:hypothetical protein
METWLVRFGISERRTLNSQWLRLSNPIAKGGPSLMTRTWRDFRARKPQHFISIASCTFGHISGDSSLFSKAQGTPSSINIL